MRLSPATWIALTVLSACAERPPAAAPPGSSRTASSNETERSAHSEFESNSRSDRGSKNGTGASADGADTSTDGTTESPEAGHFEELEVAGHPTALVWVPNNSHRPLPLFAVAHGAGGGPEWHCEFWSAVVESGAFLLCLRGHPLRKGMDAHFFPEHHTLGRLFGAAVDAVDQRYGDRVSPNHAVYIGYSQGATMGSLMLANHAARFSHALFIEGGFKTWNVARAKKFKRAGGEAAFIACGTDTCDEHAANSVRWMERAGLRARFATAKGAGHTPAGDVGLAAIEGLAWLLAPENTESPAE